MLHILITKNQKRKFYERELAIWESIAKDYGTTEFDGNGHTWTKMNLEFYRNRLYELNNN